MQIEQDEIKDLLVKAASKIVSEDEAIYFAEQNIEAHIKKSPRSDPLKSAINDLLACHEHINQKIKYDIDLPSYVKINFQSHGPLVYIKRITDELTQRSAANGMAMMSFTNSQSMHTLHTWVQSLANNKLVGIAVCNGGPDAVVPYNGTKGLFGTNPLAYGFPRQDEDPICIDMATSQIPYFEILNAHNNKEDLPANSAVNEKGEFTTNTSEALDFSESSDDPVSNIVPMGAGYKGYYLVYLLELLTSGLVGMPSSAEMSDSSFVPEEHGAILIAFNPQAMGSENHLNNSIEAINEKLKQQKPKEGTTIPIPGERTNNRYADSTNQTVAISDELITKLKELAS